MIRTIDHKLVTAQDTAAWIDTLPIDEDVASYQFVFKVLIEDYQRSRDKKPLSKDGYYDIRNAHTVACTLLHELLTDHKAAVGDFCYSEIPTNIEQLLFTVLNDAIDHFTGVMLWADYPVLRSEEIKAIVCALLKISPERYEQHKTHALYPALLSKAKSLLRSEASSK
jgi:hypothetical protein